MGLRTLAARFVRQICPPLLLDPLLGLLDRAGIVRRRRIWEGVYAHVRDVPRRGAGWSGAAFREVSVARVRRILEAAPGRLGAVADENLTLLAAVAAVVRHSAGGRLRVLEFGGGPGISYAYLSRALDDASGLEHHVVELEGVCEDGARLFGGDARVHFHRSWPEGLAGVDLVFSSSAIETVEDWQEVLRTLCAYRAEYVLLSHVCGGVFGTYASALQLVPESVVPAWFLNLEEVVDVVTGCGYRLVARSPQERVHVQDNFPAVLRLPGGHPSVLLFARNS
ncbi:MAG: methyltransferase, TIGR04325 family [Acidobacteria bacterium]|nr:methyltransferase, TIGR04325 family [Acidobacteriota bacterium]